MERWVAKLISFFLIFTLMTIAGLLPIKVSNWYNKKGAKGEYYISVINCFGGGVFFGTYLMHMAPEVRLMLEESLLTPNNIIYPLPELAIGFGFFLLLFVDKIVTIIAHYGAKSTVEPQPNEQKLSTIEMEAIKHKHGYRADGHLSNSRAASPRLVTRTHHDSISSYVSHTNDLTHEHTETHEPKANGVTHEAKINGHAHEIPTKERGFSVLTLENEQPSDDQHLSTEDAELAARPYIFLIALSIDCIFEGMSLGLQEDAYGVLMLVVAILSHELVITFSFGLRLVKLFTTKKVIIIIISYASTIPIGIIIGFAIYETGGGSNEIDIVSGFFQAIAAGIFIYITFLEILNEELTHDTYIAKPLAVLTGFLFMALMVLVEDIDTGGDGGDGSGDGNSTTPAYMQDLLHLIEP